jgi:hypothetical protein
MKRFRQTSLQYIAPRRFPARLVPQFLQNAHTLFSLVESDLNPSLQAAEQNSSGSPLRVHRTEPSNCPHLSHASAIQMPKSQSNFWVCSLVSFICPARVIKSDILRGLKNLVEARPLVPRLTIAAKNGRYERPLHREFFGEVLLHGNADESPQKSPQWTN